MSEYMTRDNAAATPTPIEAIVQDPAELEAQPVEDIEDPSHSATGLVRLPSGLPSIESANLPAVYEAARNALSDCSRIDECKDWANKMEAMASYAKQAGDDSLRQMCDRIQARAIRRCGELLREISPNKGGRPSEETRAGARPGLVEARTRKKAADDAGLSSHQAKTALRVANVPREDFDAAVETEKPATVTQLADMGKVSRGPLVDLGGRDPKDFALATKALGSVSLMLEFLNDADPEAISRGASDVERGRIFDGLASIAARATELGRLLHLTDGEPEVAQVQDAPATELAPTKTAAPALPPITRVWSRRVPGGQVEEHKVIGQTATNVIVYGPGSEWRLDRRKGMSLRSYRGIQFHIFLESDSAPDAPADDTATHAKGNP